MAVRCRARCSWHATVWLCHRRATPPRELSDPQRLDLRGVPHAPAPDELGEALVQHLGIVVASVLLGLVLAFPLALLARRYRRLQGVVIGTTTAIYTIPSLALFSLLVPLPGSAP